MSRSDLSGRRVLIVEDRYLIATEVADAVEDLGGEVLGPVSSVRAAAELLRKQPPDLALLDVNLDGEMVFPLAENLERVSTPIIFLTGYNAETLPAPWRDTPRLVKPVDPAALRHMLLHVGANGGSSDRG
jgi:DNA-binding response OmpR family regulator